VNAQLFTIKGDFMKKLLVSLALLGVGTAQAISYTCNFVKKTNPKANQEACLIADEVAYFGAYEGSKAQGDEDSFAEFKKKASFDTLTDLEKSLKLGLEKVSSISAELTSQLEAQKQKAAESRKKRAQSGHGQ